MYHREHQNPDGKNSQKPFKWIIIDSLIIGLIAVFATMPNVVPTLDQLWVMLKAFGGAFIFQLAVERGLKRE